MQGSHARSCFHECQWKQLQLLFDQCTRERLEVSSPVEMMASCNTDHNELTQICIIPHCQRSYLSDKLGVYDNATEGQIC